MNTANSSFIQGTFNEVDYQAETKEKKVKRLCVMMGQTILALYENGKYLIKPYPNWKHTVNLILEKLQTQ